MCEECWEMLVQCYCVGGVVPIMVISGNVLGVLVAWAIHLY